jgi:nitrate reductase beta subunit
MLRDRQTADTMAAPDDKGSRVNLLNWDGKGTPSGLFPPRGEPAADTSGEGRATTPDTSDDGATGPGGTGGLTGGADYR